MEWDEMFLPDKEPTWAQIGRCVDSPAWDELNKMLTESYGVAPRLEYSKCSMQRGWNIKYRKKGRNLCTVYPQVGYFKILVVVGERNQLEADCLIETCCDGVKQLYRDTQFVNGSKWLMLQVNDARNLEDAIKFIELRAGTTVREAQGI